MNDAKDQGLGILKIERSFNASVADVFAAFTKPELMSQWFHGFPQGSARVEADLRVGGKYSIVMIPDTPPDDSPKLKCEANALHYGEYLEISPPDRLSFTWIKDDFVDYSVVTIDFKASGSSTLVTLTHRLPTNTISQHNHGWNACLDNLSKFLSPIQP